MAFAPGMSSSRLGMIQRTQRHTRWLLLSQLTTPQPASRRCGLVLSKPRPTILSQGMAHTQVTFAKFCVQDSGEKIEVQTIKQHILVLNTTPRDS